jgi:hypothetical protein
VANIMAAILAVVLSERCRVGLRSYTQRLTQTLLLAWVHGSNSKILKLIELSENAVHQ